MFSSDIPKQLYKPHSDLENLFTAPMGHGSLFPQEVLKSKNDNCAENVFPSYYYVLSRSVELHIQLFFITVKPENQSLREGEKLIEGQMAPFHTQNETFTWFFNRNAIHVSFFHANG